MKTLDQIMKSYGFTFEDQIDNDGFFHYFNGDPQADFDGLAEELLENKIKSHFDNRSSMHIWVKP